MYEHKLERDVRCPLEYGFEVFGGKWKTRILCVLSSRQVMRNSELKRELVNITDAVLAATLKELVNDGLIARKQYEGVPLRVEYSLTQRGESLIPILQDICRWAGIINKEDYNNSLPQCKKCDYYAQ